MFAWGPYAIFALYKQYGSGDLIGPAMAVLPSLFAKTAICYNPIIYVGLNRQFRQAFDRFRGAQPPPARVITISTTANILDANAKRAMKNRLEIANMHNEQREDEGTNSIEEFEMRVMNESDGKRVKIQAQVLE